MKLGRLAVASVGLITAAALTACGSTTKSSDAGGGAKSGGSTKCDLIGVTMPTKSSERWIHDGDSLKKQLEAKG